MTQRIPSLQGGTDMGEPEQPLDYLPLPREMNTFELPVFPDIDNLDDYQQALVFLHQLEQLLDASALQEAGMLSLDILSPEEMTLIQELLGEGEVAIRFQDPALPEIQETRLAGVWWVRQRREDQWQQWLEVARIPKAVIRYTFARARRPPIDLQGEAAWCNAAPVMTELLEASLRLDRGDASDADKVVNLSLLPFTVEDHQLLAEYLGTGETLVLSRGYGNCRITSTATPWIWRVQYFNNTEQLILDTLEVTRVPEVACAAREDLEDSAERLREIKELLYV